MMSTYSVTLEYRQTYFANIEVSADSAEEACERALALGDSVEWESTCDGCECGPTYAAEVQTVSAAHIKGESLGNDRTARIVRDAIDESIATQSIVTIDDAPGLREALTAWCDDETESDGIAEYWSNNDDGRPWRVHVKMGES